MLERFMIHCIQTMEINRMKKYTTQCLALASVCGLMLSVNEARGQAAVETPKKTYDIAAFVWPSYHKDDRARVFWPMGIGEWETVMKNEAHFEGHQQPRRPIWGYVNEADRYVMEMQIAAAADHGVNVFIYDWYWYDGMPYLEACLNEGYLKARNNSRVKFYLMWANHDVNLMWDRRNADDAATQRNKAKIWQGNVNRTEFEKIVHRWITNYFSQPSYYKIDGKPVLMIYDLNELIEGLGSVEATRDALAWFREEVKKAGHPGLELQLSMRRHSDKSLSGIPGDNVGTQKEVVEKLGFDSLTHYQFCHIENVNRDYNAIVQDVKKQWAEIKANYKATYYPHISIGWDSSPRTPKHVGAVTKNNTPENFEKALREAKAFVDAQAGRPRLITVNSWNEWTETSYLQPCELYGYGYLEAVKRVFGAGE